MRKLYYIMCQIGCKIECNGSKLAQYGYFHYIPNHPDNPYNRR